MQPPVGRVRPDLGRGELQAADEEDEGDGAVEDAVLRLDDAAVRPDGCFVGREQRVSFDVPPPPLNPPREGRESTGEGEKSLTREGVGHAAGEGEPEDDPLVRHEPQDLERAAVTACRRRRRHAPGFGDGPALGLVRG